MNVKNLRLRAVIGVAVAGIAFGGMATAASAGKPAEKPINAAENNESYWEDLGYGDCHKVEDPADPFVVPAPDDGNAWTLLVVKSGSAQSVEVVNDLIANPEEGDSYSHSSGKGISHIILCQDEGNSYPQS